ncbi:MAG: hypothetical protein KQJ78_18085 [Deltaproteobacteria bacterium]|nr:hypothetical protein [Deltaproteobacteria bacterium]
MTAKLTRYFWWVPALLCLGPVLVGTSPAWALEVEIVSQTSAGCLGNGPSLWPACSASGRWVAFESTADDLVSGDTNGESDLFVRDRRTGDTTRVSVDSNGGESNGGSQFAAISADGRYVAFWSNASNLVSGDTNGHSDYFLHDRQTGQTSLVGPAITGASGLLLQPLPALSGTGQFVAFATDDPGLVPGDTNNAFDVMVYDTVNGTLERVSVNSSAEQGDASSFAPAISADGRYVCFASFASNLAADDTNGVADIFVHDRQTGETTLVSQSTLGGRANRNCLGPAISADGRRVAFLSASDNLVNLPRAAAPPLASAFPRQVYLRNLDTSETTLVSARLDGALAAQDCERPAISGNGQFVAFVSHDPDLVTGDTNLLSDAFVRDLTTEQTTLVSTSATGVQGNGLTDERTAISHDGSTAFFATLADNLVSGDGNGYADVYAVYPLVGHQRLMYRAYNLALMYHFFTTRAAEFANAVAAGYQDESTGVERRLFQVSDQALYGNNPLHRLYNPNAGRHYYTFSNAERDSLMALGWNFERDEGCVFTTSDVAPPETIEIYHLYHAVIGTHLYTSNAAEVAAVLASIPDWQQHRSLGFAFRGPGATVRDYTELPPHSTVLEAAARLAGVR